MNNIPTSQVGKMKHRDVKWLAHSHSNSVELPCFQSRMSNSRVPSSERELVRLTIHPRARENSKVTQDGLHCNDAWAPSKSLPMVFLYLLIDLIWFITQRYVTCIFKGPDHLIVLCKAQPELKFSCQVGYWAGLSLEGYSSPKVLWLKFYIKKILYFIKNEKSVSINTL